MTYKTTGVIGSVSLNTNFQSKKRIALRDQAIRNVHTFMQLVSKQGIGVHGEISCNTYHSESKNCLHNTSRNFGND